MFMYSAGLAVASRLGVELKLDTQGFSSESFRKYSLDIFPNITEHSASFREIWNIAPFQAIAGRFRIRGNSVFKHPFRRLLYESMRVAGLLETRKPGNVPFSRIYYPPDFSYHEEFTRIQDNTYIIGYWESEKFFAEIKDEVRRKFTFPPEYFSSELATRIMSCNSVAIHVRRGDKSEQDKDGSNTAHYLKSAIDKISSLTENPAFFVFSDNIEWCKKNLSGIYDGEYVFVEGNTPPRDMALMTVCRHVIIGTSTFSWWGAWLNSNPGKIVIAPAVKFWSENVNDRQDLIPDSWIKIS